MRNAHLAFNAVSASVRFLPISAQLCLVHRMFLMGTNERYALEPIICE